MKKYIYTIILILLTSCSSQKCDEVEINMEKSFTAYEIKIPIKAGIIVFETEGVFRIDTSVYSDICSPWGDVVYITITTPDGIEKKLSNKICRTDYTPVDGDIIIRTKFNTGYFIPWMDNIWTGTGDDKVSFQECPVILKIRNVKSCKKSIPLLKELPAEKKKETKTGRDSSLSVPSILKPGLDVLKKAMSPDGNNSRHNLLGEPLPEEEQEKIKKGFKDATNLLKSTFGFEGGEENDRNQ